MSCAIPPGVDTYKGRPEGPGVDTHKGRSWWGGPRGALHVTFCPGGGRIRAATPCASAQLQHLATQDHRRVVLFGLNDSHFSVFSRETGNLTGFTNFEPSMASKWLELVKGIAPNVTRVAYLFNPNTAPLLYARAVESAAPSLLIKLLTAEVRNANEMKDVIEQFAREPDSALLVLPDLFTATNRRSIIALAVRHRLPAVYPFRYFVASGGLMSYGIETLETYRQAASYVARVLKGENPSDLPVQAPTKYELVINLKTAKALGLTVPPTLLATADEVIE
jgi:putative tryptophan/tyrosine transport system substrate-binding protein